MSSELVIFGCSHSNWQLKPTWVDILEVNGVRLKNYATGGSSNEGILKNLVDYVRSNNTVSPAVIQLTYPERIVEVKIKEVYPYNLYSVMHEAIQLPNSKITEKFYEIFNSINNEWKIKHYQTQQYSIYSILKNCNMNYCVLGISEQRHNLITEFEPDYIDVNINMDENLQYQVYRRMQDKSWQFDRHMNPHSHVAIAEKIIEKYNLKPLSNRAWSYVHDTDNLLRSVTKKDFLSNENKKDSFWKINKIWQYQLNDIKNKYSVNGG